MPEPHDGGGLPLRSPQLCCNQASPLLPLLFQHFDVLIIYFCSPVVFMIKWKCFPWAALKRKAERRG